MATLYKTIGGTAGRLDRQTPPTALEQFQDYLGKVAAHVPTEIISIYVLGKSLAPTFEGVWAIICWALALFLRWKGTEGEGKTLNTILTLLAYPLWAMAMGGTILGYAFPEQVTGLAILVFAVLAGALYNNK
jgi:hypothetical protein